MAHREGQRESFSRKRLDFTAATSPVCGKTFYLDIRKPLLREKVMKCVRHLGGRVEDFLCKDVHLFVTDRPVSVSDAREATLKDSSENPSSPSCVPLPSPDAPLSSQGVGSSLFTPSSAKPLTRTQTLLLKAQQSYSGSSQPVNREQSCNASIIQSAITMGIKVMSVQTFLASYQVESKRSRGDNCLAENPARISRSTRSNSSPLAEQKENQPCVKVEDFSRKYKPLFKTFDRLPEISYELGLNSRTSNSKKRQKTTPGTVCATPKDSRIGQRSVARPSTVRRDKGGQRGGYCESCDYWFTGRVREHLNGSRHQQFAKNSENYESLDKVTSKLPGLELFLSSVSDATPTRVCGHVQKTDVEMIDLTAVVPTRPSVPPTYRAPALDNCCDVVETDDTPTTSGKPKVLRKLLAKCTLGESSDPHMSVDKSDQNIAATHNDLDGDILTIVNSVKQNLTNFEDATQLGDLELPPPTLERVDVSSAVPSRLSDTAPVLQPVSAQSPSLHDPARQCRVKKRSPRKRLDFGAAEVDSSHGKARKKTPEQKPSTPPAPVFMFGQNDTIKSPSQLLMRFMQASSFSHETNPVEQTRKRRRSRDQSNSQDVYFATKTSEMKLKLCRVSERMTTPRSKSNKELTSYWKVKKTGDCKLVFSPKYSRKSHYSRRRSIRRDEDQENQCLGGSDEPRGKRVKVGLF